MYIIKTVSKSKKNTSKKYYTYRLMESVRIGKKIKKITLLNLGSTFDVEQKDWAELSARIHGIIHQTPSLFELDSTLEARAQVYAKQIIASKAKAHQEETPFPKDDNHYHEIDIATVKNSHPRSVGVEHVVYETIKELKLDTKLHALGLTPTQSFSALGSLVAKIARPSSDRQTHNWLSNTSGIHELMGCDFHQISSANIYRAADVLLAHKEELEAHLYAQQKELFAYEETLTLYDLTNTYFEGRAQGIARAKRGRSKEKRSDAPLVTLGVMLDGSGFVKRSEIFDGNVSEPATFQEMLDRLSVPVKQNLFPPKKALVVMDAGIATSQNIAHLVEKGYEYIVVSRKKEKPFDASKSTPVKLDSKHEVIVRAQKVINEAGEVELFVHSKDRASKEDAMLERVQSLLVESLQYLKEGLTIKRRTKHYEKVIERIGRLKEKYAAVAHYYAITVTKESNGHNAIDIQWREKRSLDNKSSLHGVYCLRSNNTTMDERTLWKTYTTLTDLEAVFKSLKSELGLRPIYHQKQSRVDGHLFLTLLAYSIVHTIRYKLKRKGIHYSWDRIRSILEATDRITTSMKKKDGTTIHIRKSVELEPEEKEIYDALNLKHQIGEVDIVYM
jgi:transposase